MTVVEPTLGRWCWCWFDRAELAGWVLEDGGEASGLLVRDDDEGVEMLVCGMTLCVERFELRGLSVGDNGRREV